MSHREKVVHKLLVSFLERFVIFDNSVHGALHLSKLGLDGVNVGKVCVIIMGRCLVRNRWRRLSVGEMLRRTAKTNGRRWLRNRRRRSVLWVEHGRIWRYGAGERGMHWRWLLQYGMV